MFKFLSNRKLMILLLGIMLFVAVMGLTISNRAQLTWPEQFVRDSILWLQEKASVPTRAVTNFFNDWYRIAAVHEENEVLRAAAYRHSIDQARLNQLEAENKRLQKALKFTVEQSALHDYRFYFADVISYSGNAFNPTIVINRGKKDGVDVDMAVMSVDGLVGRISSVSQYYATVQLLLQLDANNRDSKPIAATIKGKETVAFGVVDEYDRKKGILRMSKIDPLDPLKVGDTVVTSGLGQLFPSGLEIGKIVKREVGEFGITHVAEIKPSAPFAHLRELFVVEVPVLR